MSRVDDPEDGQVSTDLPVLLLTVPQAAAMCQVSTDRIYEWTYEPGFPAVAGAHQMRIHARLFEEWLAERARKGRKGLQPEVQEDAA